MSVVSLGDAKQFLNITSSTSDVELTVMANAAELHVAKLVGPLSPQTIVETIYEHGSQLVLRTCPVAAVTSVSIAAYLGQDGVDDTAAWVLDPATGVLRRKLVGGFVPWFGSGSVVTVTYTTGRAQVPEDLYQAILYVLGAMWESQRGASPMPMGVNSMPAAPGPGTSGFMVPSKALDLLRPYLSPPGFA